MTEASSSCSIPTSSIVTGDLGEGGHISAKIGSVEFPVGADSNGPNPYDLLSTSLAACTVMTIRFQASRMRYPLSHVDVAVSYHREAGSEGSFFERSIKLEGALSGEQRESLLRAANLCPVGKALGTPIRTTSQNALQAVASAPNVDYQSDLNDLSIPNIDPD